MTWRLIAVACALVVAAGCGDKGAPQYSGQASEAEQTYGSCAFCHGEIANNMVATGGHESLDLKCGFCHPDLSPGTVGPGHRGIPRCVDCHSVQRTHDDLATAQLNSECTACHTPHGSPNLFLVRQQILTPAGSTRPINFTNEAGRADGSFASQSQPGSGLCEVCHQTTKFYRADGTGAAHFTFTCVSASCHDHGRGFEPPPPTATPTVTETPTPTATGTPTPTVPPDATATFTPEPVTQLRARRVTSPPVGIDDPVWDGIAAFEPSLSDVSTGLLYGDGQLNATGTFNGLTDFNDGDAAGLQLRAVHDGDKLYILAQWNDQSFDLDRQRWLFDGPSDPLKSGESADGWTSQHSDDKIGLAFEIEPASSEFGTFADVGCAASCHDVAAQGLEMQPQSGRVDLWSWKTGRSEPLGYVGDQVSDPTEGRRDDAGIGIEHRNQPPGGNDRSGPDSEWDGTTQQVTRSDGQQVTLDPAYIILEGHRMPFEGDAAAGEVTYAANCAVCHGNNGQGGIGPALTQPAVARMTRAELNADMAAPTHPGATAYNGLTAAQKTDLIARLRGFAGVPGYYLTTPQGSVADVVTQSNTDYALVNSTVRVNYRLMMTRSLDTGNGDDAQFTPGGAYPFGVALMDGDGRNHIGSSRETLSLDP